MEKHDTLSLCDLWDPLSINMGRGGGGVCNTPQTKSKIDIAMEYGLLTHFDEYGQNAPNFDSCIALCDP